MAYKMSSPEGKCILYAITPECTCLIAPAVMGNWLLYIVRVFIHYKSLYNHPLPKAMGTIQNKSPKTCFSKWH